MEETCIDDFYDMVETIAQVVGRHVDRPFAIYGHSMGAGLAFELARRLKQNTGKQPLHLFVGAHRSPIKPYSYPTVRSVSDEQVLDVLMRFNGMPRALLENRELLDLFLPILRADLLVCESYAYEGHSQLDCPITLFTGAQDTNVAPHELAGWEVQTSAHFRHRVIDGDHFFLKSHQEELLTSMFDDLAEDMGNYPLCNPRNLAA